MAKFIKQLISLDYGWSYDGEHYIDAKGNIRDESDYASYVERRKKYDASWEPCSIDDLIDIKSKADNILEDKRIEIDPTSGVEKLFYRAVAFSYDSFSELQFSTGFDGTQRARFRDVPFDELGYALNRMNSSFNEKLNFVLEALSLDSTISRQYDGYNLLEFVFDQNLYRLVWSSERETIRIKLVRKLIQSAEVQQSDTTKKQDEYKIRQLMGL